MVDQVLEHRIDRCITCGACLADCPVMGLAPERARRERVRLNLGARSGRVLADCTSCLSCNVRCPQDCRPAHLTMSRWHESYQRNGLPARAAWYDPNHHPNFRTYVVARLPEDEQDMVRAWADTSRCEEILFPGCNMITAPYLLRTRLLHNLPVRGALGLCCGETYYRMGLIEPLRETAAKLEQVFGAMGVRRMVLPCTAGFNMFSRVLPRAGARFEFEVEHLLARLWRQVADGTLTVGSGLGITVSIHDSCHAKVFGTAILDLVRNLLNAIGVDVVEQPLIRERALCCGIGGGFSAASAYHPARIARATFRALRSAHQADADAIVVYCAGCLQMFSVGQQMFPFFRKPVYHILELLQAAVGERPARRHRSRARLFLEGMVRYQAPALLSSERTRVDLSGSGPVARHGLNRGSSPGTSPGSMAGSDHGSNRGPGQGGHHGRR